MNIFKRNKGITLISLVISIIIILIISGMVIYYSTKGLAIQKVNNLYSDIEQIESQVDSYYIKNNELPIIDDIEITFNDSSNVNDGNIYHIIDLSELDGLNLNYGRDFEIVKNNNTYSNNEDIYIINDDSHTIYYIKGIEYDGEVYYSIDDNYEQIET